jgi:CRP-like cAMP-binding protein
VGGPIGKGASAVVRRGRHRASGREVAIKEVLKSSVNTGLVETEIAILQRVGSNPHVAKLLDVYETKKAFFLVMELAKGGELFERLADKGAFSERIAAGLMAQIGDALAFLHAQGVSHRDIKPENLLLVDSTEESGLRLVDFGLSKCSTTGVGSGAGVGSVGTWAYWPPEAFADFGSAEGRALDMWALGVVLYIVLSGYHPFDPRGDATDAQVQRAIRAAHVQFDGDAWRKVGEPAKDLLRKLLRAEPERRLTVEGLLTHPWISGGAARDGAIAGSAERLRGFVDAHRRLRATAFSMMLRAAQAQGAAETKRLGASGRFEATLLASAFRMFDADGKGFIDAADVQRVMRDVTHRECDDNEANELLGGGAGGSGGSGSGSGSDGTSTGGSGGTGSTGGGASGGGASVGGARTVQYGDYLSMMSAMPRRTFAPNEVICARGEKATSFYLLLGGEVTVHKPAAEAAVAGGAQGPVTALVGWASRRRDSTHGALVGRLNAGEFFGENALLLGRDRTSTCCAGEAGAEVLELSNDDFNALMEHQAGAAPTSAAAALGSGGAGGALTSDASTRTALNFIKMAASMQRLSFEPGELVFLQGDVVRSPRAVRRAARERTRAPRCHHVIASPRPPSRPATTRANVPTFSQADRFYILVDGQLRVVVEGVEVTTLGKGECFGEMGVLNNAPRTATVVAKTRATCLALDAVHLRGMLVKSSALRDGLRNVADVRSLGRQAASAAPGPKSEASVTASPA